VVQRLQGLAGNRAIAALLRPALSGPSLAIQRLRAEDVPWDEVTAVQHLSKGAYEVVLKSGASYVVKYHKDAKLLYEVGQAESPLLEAMAAKVGELPELGAPAPETVMVETGSAIGKKIIDRLREVGGDGAKIADGAAGTTGFLVMARAPGLPADQSRGLFEASDPADQDRLFHGLGRLWAFDQLINNSDRFGKNMGNIILGPGGSVVGIDQAIGQSAAGPAKDHGKDEDKAFSVAAALAERALEEVLVPAERRKKAKEVVKSLAADLGPTVEQARAKFELAFETGVVDGGKAIAELPPDRLEKAMAELPEFAKAAAQQVGVSGAVAIQQVFAGRQGDFAGQQKALRDEKEAGTARAKDVLAPLSRQRDAVLRQLANAHGALRKEWEEINRQYVGKDKYWMTRTGHLATLKNLGRDDYEKAEASLPQLDQLPIPAQQAIRKQQEIWRFGLQLLWSVAAGPAQVTHATVKDTISALGDLLATEQKRSPLL
jgi:hypothetical protein